jgi:hypothetical protein
MGEGVEVCEVPGTIKPWTGELSRELPVELSIELPDRIADRFQDATGWPAST